MHQVKKTETNLKIAYIALGSNLSSELGDSVSLVKSAYELLLQQSIIIDKSSPIYETPAFPAGNGPNYVNTVIKIKTALKPDALLRVLHSIEDDLGRTREVRWGARVIDIDLLDYDGLLLPNTGIYEKWRNMPLEQQISTWPEGLILPHPRIEDRAFVLVPLKSIEPDWVHPVTKETLDVLIARIPPHDLDAVVLISDC
ncbi:2-amino-4-hydroxy-6-hydroxymethyldihydropteridine diphosphokinase [Amylibacter sp. SFDW26]|uniref:2-amino-4-hydroxy-6- hydroxymethyldihydropteridine diphosphokinase n=1 Tax=Amylibacter sp. SFDW26 TaxID=2652722 RepID=UPI00126293DC|nr:2-amino-4-hydroxy-6-hydroxymethyldihydropteridine diphosphokinase [Amylibacter sp. SFDW26]KAB7614804.1 2-amino-4-hydroxy-6-hydroxymethyldihydropteridine diphosphokinase [Amylibacter sp. SFDW26]